MNVWFPSHIQLCKSRLRIGGESPSIKLVVLPVEYENGVEIDEVTEGRWRGVITTYACEKGVIRCESGSESESRSVVSDSVIPWTIVPGILQARIMEWVAIPFSRGSSRPRDQTQVSCLAGGYFTKWAMREAQSGCSRRQKWWVWRAWQGYHDIRVWVLWEMSWKGGSCGEWETQSPSCGGVSLLIMTRLWMWPQISSWRKRKKRDDQG